jgi:hypothetical protein
MRIGLPWSGPKAEDVDASDVGSRHVVVATGRDYADVSPLKSVYSGAPSSTPNVEVQLTRQA